jgi:hypothetical protein
MTRTDSVKYIKRNMQMLEKIKIYLAKNEASLLE